MRQYSIPSISIYSSPNSDNTIKEFPLGGLGGFLQSKIDNLNKPKGSLGRLESLALQIGLIQQTFSPREVTWQQMINYGKGGGGVNMFCRQHGFKLLVVDAGVDYDFPEEKYPHIIQRKVGYGTRNFLHEPAMTQEEFDRCLAIGAEQVEACHNEGCNIISFGEMGIGNTSPSSVIMHLFLDITLIKCVGAGSGLSSKGVKHKYDVLKASIANYFATLPESHDAAYTIRYFFGYEMACAVGGMLRAAELGMIILVDGFIMTACMLAASKLMLNEMDNFSHAEITKYF